MEELKIDEELRDLLPPLSKDEKDRLEQNLLKDGYLGEPIYTWNGYIVDGHNRYELCKKHGIEFPYEDPFKGKGFEKVNIMEWMIHRQLGKRNLEPYQRLLAVEKYESKFREMAKENQCRNGGDKKSESSKRRSPIDDSKKVHTDKEIAKLAKVGSGTKARWDYVKNNDTTGEVKGQMMSGEIPITRAYDILQAEKKKKKQEAKREDTEKVNDAPAKDSNEDESKCNDEITRVCQDVKAIKDIENYWNFMNEIECIEDSIGMAIDDAKCVLFEERCIDGKITKEERDIAIECVSDLVVKLNELKNKIKKTKLKGEK